MSAQSRFIRGFRKGMSGFGQGISSIVNSALLSLVYLVGVGATAIFAKVIGKHFMDMKAANGADSYWTELDLKKKSVDEYYRQF